MFLCSLRYCLKFDFSKGVYSFTLSTVYIYHVCDQARLQNQITEGASYIREGALTHTHTHTYIYTVLSVNEYTLFAFILDITNCCVLAVLAQKITWFSNQALLGRLFSARSSGVRAQKNRTSDHRWMKCKKVVNKTYNYEFMMRLLICRSLTLVLGKDQDEQATNA